MFVIMCKHKTRKGAEWNIVSMVPGSLYPTKIDALFDIGMSVPYDTEYDYAVYELIPA